MSFQKHLAKNPFDEALRIVRDLRYGVPCTIDVEENEHTGSFHKTGFAIYPSEPLSDGAVLLTFAALQQLDPCSVLIQDSDKLECTFDAHYENAPSRQLEAEITHLRDELANGLVKQEDGSYRLAASPALRHLNLKEIFTSLFKNYATSEESGEAMSAKAQYKLPEGKSYTGSDGVKKTELNSPELQAYLREANIAPENAAGSGITISSYVINAPAGKALVNALRPIGGRDTVN